MITNVVMHFFSDKSVQIEIKKHKKLLYIRKEKLMSFLGADCNMFLVLGEQEMIESIRESVVYMAHTHDGARVAMHCLWHGTAKVWAHTLKHTHTHKALLLPKGNFVKTHCRNHTTINNTTVENMQAVQPFSGGNRGAEVRLSLVYSVFVLSQTFLFLFQDRKVIIKTMKTYMVKFATVSLSAAQPFKQTSYQFFISSLFSEKFEL